MRNLTVGLMLLVLLAGTGAQAGTVTLQETGALALKLYADQPLLQTARGAIVQGNVTLSPAEPLAPGLTAVFVLDDQVRLLSSLSHPELQLDTRQLSDGLHEFRLDVTDGTRLALSTGTLPLHVANQTPELLTQQARRATGPGFNKVYRKVLLREIVWFDGREADLEKHGFIRQGRTYITLTDLIRHIGGNITWGPSSSYILVERNGTKVQVVPGASYVLVDGQRQSLGHDCLRIENRTYVPIRPMLEIFNLKVDWNRIQGRALVARNSR